MSMKVDRSTRRKRVPKPRERTVPLGSQCEKCGQSHRRSLRYVGDAILCRECARVEPHTIGWCLVAGKQTTIQEHHVLTREWSDLTMPVNVSLHGMITHYMELEPRFSPTKYPNDSNEYRMMYTLTVVKALLSMVFGVLDYHKGKPKAVMHVVIFVLVITGLSVGYLQLTRRHHLQRLRNTSKATQGLTRENGDEQ